MVTKNKIDRTICEAREAGMCTAMMASCNTIGDSICEPIQKSFANGIKLMELKNNGKTVHFFGRCPFCSGEPVVKKSSWLRGLILRHGSRVVCSKCNAELLAVNEVFVGNQLIIHTKE